MEIYNEIVYDLLSDKKEVCELREDVNWGIIVCGIKNIIIKNQTQINKILS